MTVAELITQLQAMPQHATALVYAYEAVDWVPIVSARCEAEDSKAVVYLECKYDTE